MERSARVRVPDLSTMLRLVSRRVLHGLDVRGEISTSRGSTCGIGGEFRAPDSAFVTEERANPVSSPLS